MKRRSKKQMEPWYKEAGLTPEEEYALLSMIECGHVWKYSKAIGKEYQEDKCTKCHDKRVKRIPQKKWNN